MVSGSIDPEDPSPQAAAWREIQEETTLTQSSLELIRQGKSYILPDESIGREWTIYPFAFRLKETTEGGKGEKGITLDWEHDEWAWYDPLDIEDSESFGAVPRLAESLRRVWFEKDLGGDAGAVLTDGLDRLKNDHQSGARQLASASLQILRDIILKMDTQQATDQWWTKIRFAAWHICKNGRESMGAAILSVLLAALKSMEEILQQDRTTTQARCAFVEELDRRIAARQHAAKAISVALASFLQDQFASRVESRKPINVLTVSESSTITHALHHVIATSPLYLDVRILESRPLFEGVSFAGSLLSKQAVEGGEAREVSQSKLRLTLFTDASSALASRDVDIVLLGADRISENGDVSNKTGSLPAVLSAKHVSPEAKTVILSEQEKVAPLGGAAEHAVENSDATQMTRAWEADFDSEKVQKAARTVSHGLVGCSATAGQPALASGPSRVEISNIVFEWIPPNLVDVYVTENGIATLEDIKNLSKTLSREEERFFRDI